MPELQSGIYTITAFAGEGGFVARAPVEDSSLLPKGIIARAKSAPPVENLWEIKKVGEGVYTFSILRNPVAELDGKLQAILTDDVKPQTWKLISDERVKNLYIITSEDGKAWHVDGRDKAKEARIIVGFFPIPLIYPPIYPPELQFQIEPAPL